MGRVFKHNFTYADEAGRNVSLTYEAEHGEHVRIVPLDDEAGLESFGGNVTSAEIVNMTFASAAHADSFHARVAPGDVLVGGAHWGYADAAASQFALLSGPSILLRVEDALNRSDAVVSARVRAVPLESLFRSATFKLRVRLRPEDLRGLEMPQEPVQTNGPDERALARRELSFNTALKKVGRFVERNTKKVVEEIVSFAEEVKKHLVNLAAIFTDAISMQPARRFYPSSSGPSQLLRYWWWPRFPDLPPLPLRPSPSHVHTSPYGSLVPHAPFYGAAVAI